MCAKSLQSCPTLCDPVDCSPPGSSIHGILQARILEWVAISFSRGSSCLQQSNVHLVWLLHCRQFFTTEPLGSPPNHPSDQGEFQIRAYTPHHCWAPLLPMWALSSESHHIRCPSCVSPSLCCFYRTSLWLPSSCLILSKHHPPPPPNLPRTIYSSVRGTNSKVLPYPDLLGVSSCNLLWNLCPSLP